MTSMLLTNARIFTCHDRNEWANAALIRDGRFVAVGRLDDIDAPADAEVLDAGGRLVLPGLTDGHAHLLGTGFAMQGVDLKATPTLDEALARVSRRVAETPAGQWVSGAGWDQNDWPAARFPDRRDLDRVAPDHPVVLDHTSGHCIWVNSAALRAAGIIASTIAPDGGAIDHDDDGEPAGILRDNASRLVYAVVPPPTPLQRIEAMERAIAHAHSLGVTGAHAMDVGRGEWQALHALNDSGRLRFRTRMFLTARKLDEWIDRNATTGDGDDMLRVGGVKFFADGALGSLTAWMFEPYEGTDEVGFPLQPPEDLERYVRRCLEHGLAPAVHAIGDRANRTVLNIFERARDLAPDLPRRIEHAQLLTESDVPRFGKLGVIASVQPIHATQDRAKVDRHWGARGRFAYALSSLAAAGATLAFGSDSPVETMDPLAGIHAAVCRRDAAGDPEDAWYPHERISIANAIRAYMRGCAAAVRDPYAGRIAPGAHADFVVLAEDILAAHDPMRIVDARIDTTVVDGGIVYGREA